LQTDDLQMSDLEEPQPWHWFAVVAFEYAVLVGVFTSLYFVFDMESYLKFPIIFALLVVLGARQHGLGVLEHDGAHRLVLRNPEWNDLVTKLLTALPLSSSLFDYRQFHSQHHQYVGTPNDSELTHIKDKQLGKQFTLPFRWSALFRHWLLDCVGGAIPHMMMLIKLTKPKKARCVIEIVFFQITLIITLIILGLWWVPLVWFGALWTTFWASFRVRIWVEHVGATSEEGHTHSLKKPVWWVRFFFLPNNVWAHAAHHHSVRTPFGNLPEAQLRLQQRIPGTTFWDLFKKLEA